VNHERVALVAHRVPFHAGSGKLRRNREQFSDRKPNLESGVDDLDGVTRQRLQLGQDEELFVGEGRLETELPRDAQQLRIDDERFDGFEVERFGQKTPKRFSGIFDRIVAGEVDASLSGGRSSDEKFDGKFSGFRDFRNFVDGRR